MKNFAGLLIACLLMAGCGSSKKIASPAPASLPADSAMVENKAMSVNDVLTRGRISFNTFEGKADLDVKSSGSNIPDATAKIQMKRNEYIWVSVQAKLLGIEAARLYVFADSVVFIDKIRREVTIRPVSYLQQLVKLPVDLNSMQDLLIGNPVFYCEGENQMIVSSIGYKVSGECNGKTSTLTFDTAAALIFSTLHENGSNKNFQQKLTDFTRQSDILFARRREYYFEDKDKTSATIAFEGMEFNKDLSPSFSIPENYRRK